MVKVFSSVASDSRFIHLRSRLKIAKVTFSEGSPPRKTPRAAAAPVAWMNRRRLNKSVRIGMSSPDILKNCITMSGHPLHDGLLVHGENLAPAHHHPAVHDAGVHVG